MGESEARVFARGLFKTRPEVMAGKALFAAAAAKARDPALYTRLGAPDTVMGRFELYTVHVLLLVLRLKGRGPAAQETVQALFDAYLENLDIALREMGVGDLSMGKKMKKLGQAFYGRVKTYELALGDAGAMEDVLARTVFEGIEDARPAGLAAYVRAVHDALAVQDDRLLLGGEVNWPEVSS